MRELKYCKRAMSKFGARFSERRECELNEMSNFRTTSFEALDCYSIYAAEGLVLNMFRC